MFQYKDIKVGADPELFIRDAKGKYISAIDKVGGSKEKPKKIDRFGHAVQEDNVLVEYNIRPAKTVAEFVKSHEFVLDYLAKALPDYSLDFAASAEFSAEELAHPKAWVFGCDPDYNAWLMEVNPPMDARGVKLRTAGGHVHVGYTNPEIKNQVDLVHSMDLFFGVPSVLLDPDKRRREMYGKAGAFRPKKYGVEFRTPSNFWIRDRKTIEWAFNSTLSAVRFLNEGNLIGTVLGKTIQKTINSGDERTARSLCEEFSISLG